MFILINSHVFMGKLVIIIFGKLLCIQEGVFIFYLFTESNFLTESAYISKVLEAEFKEW